MGDDFKCADRFDKFDKFDKDCRHDDFHGHDEEWNLGDWLPILIILFLLCGGTNIFGGGCRDDCCDNGGFGGSWLLILILIFLFLGNQKDGKGFGLFG